MVKALDMKERGARSCAVLLAPPRRRIALRLHCHPRIQASPRAFLARRSGRGWRSSCRSPGPTSCRCRFRNVRGEGPEMHRRGSVRERAAREGSGAAACEF